MDSKKTYRKSTVISTLLLSTVVLSIILYALPSYIKAQTEEAWIAVDPPRIIAKFKDFFDSRNKTRPYNGEFFVAVNITATDLHSLEYKLKWNKTLFNITSYTIHSLWENHSVIITDETLDADGYMKHHLNVVADETAPPFNGSAIICNYTMKVEYQPYYPDPSATTALVLEETVLTDSEDELIDHNTYDSEYEIEQAVVPLVGGWGVNPINWSLPVGANCTVEVRISNVTSYPSYAPEMAGVWGYDFALLYNTSVLDCLKVELPKGHFLEPKSAANIYVLGPTIQDDYNATHGRIRVAAVLLGAEEHKTGEGVLANITFTITGSGSGSPLHFNPRPGWPFPIDLSYYKHESSFAVPSRFMSTFEVQPREEVGEGLPLEYIAATIIIIVLAGSIALYYVRKKRSSED